MLRILATKKASKGSGAGAGGEQNKEMELPIHLICINDEEFESLSSHRPLLVSLVAADI